MGIIFYGTRLVPVDVDEYYVNCKCCETQTSTDVMVFSKYYHLYWIPVFPVAKQANIMCNNCGMKTYELPFDSKLLSNYEEVKGKYKHPWYSYSLTGLFVLTVLLMLLLK